MAEWDLRSNGTGVQRVLMNRLSPENAWRDVATFASYNDAEWVLRHLRKASSTDDRMDEVLAAVEAVLVEWSERGDGGCEVRIQERLREACRAL